MEKEYKEILLKKISDITFTNYEELNEETYLIALEELYNQYMYKCDELKDLKRDIEENYKKIKIDYGIYDEDFI